MLVDYSDSEDDEAETTGPVAGAAPIVAPPAAQPPAKKARKEINLQSLLQRHDAALPFDQTKQLPSDFFDSAPTREEDAGELSLSTEGKRGWAALSSMLPAPKNAAKKSVTSNAASLYARAKPLVPKHRCDGCGTSATLANASPPAAISAAAGVPHAAAGRPEAQVGAEEYESFGATIDPLEGSCDGGSGVCSSAAGAAAVTLRPHIDTSMYLDATPTPGADVPSALSSSGLTYNAPVGPAFAPPDAAEVAGYDEVGDGYGGYDLSEGKVVDVSQADLRRALGQSKQYDFAPPPQKEVQIAANFYSRKTGEVEANYKVSGLQKRKHQINSLAADAAARSSEILARGSKSMKSKKETAAKYGW